MSYVSMIISTPQTLFTHSTHILNRKNLLKFSKKTESLQNKDKEFTQLLDSWKAKDIQI